ncbi:MAG: hypothetical protein V3U03_17400 [Myxococcota bacterium]
MKTGKLCSICLKAEVISREGWCRRCLRGKLRVAADAAAVSALFHLTSRPGPSPWGENAVRELEGGR